MGNENPRNDFDQENWETLARIGVKSVLKNKMTGSLLDLYQAEQAGDHLVGHRDEEIFKWRKERTTQEHIPLLFHYEIQRGMLGSSQKHRVFTQHLTRLIELPPISKQEAFLILEHILQVLPLLYKQIGLFHANLYTISVNDSGRTKIWVNQNLAINHPEEDDVIRNPSQNLELTIVNNLVRMLKTKVYNNQSRPQYPFSLNFLETGRYIKETRLKYPQYEISKVYLNRNEFNQSYKAALCQKVEQNFVVPQGIKQEQGEIPLSSRKKGSSPRKIPTENTKTESSDTHIQFYPSQAYNNIPNQHLINHHNPPLFYYPPNAIPLGRMPVIYASPPNQLPLRNPPQIPIIPVQNHNKTMQPPQQTNERQLEQSYYINQPSFPLSPFQTQPNHIPSPTKMERKTLSPSKFLKKVTMESPKSFSPKKQSSLPPSRHSSPSNRHIILSPTKKYPLPAIEQKKPHDFRPISANKPLFNRQLSRILQQQQTKYDSLYLRSPDKTQQGFNVELVESIYVKSSETEEGQ